MNDKVIISCALTGAWSPKEKNLYVPYTPQEIADDAYASWKAGAAIVHLHMRDENGQGTMDKERFRESVRLLREHKDCDVIINCTSSGAANLTEEERMAHFIGIPEIEMGSCDIGSFNWADVGIFDNNPAFLKKLCNTYNQYDVKPEVEIFDYGMLGNAKYYIEKGYIKGPMWCQLVLGVLGGMDATVDNLLYLVRHLPENTVWSATGIGTGHLPIMYTAVALGGHLRVGLEDNLYMSRGLKATNPMMVERAVRVVKEFGKQPATPAEAREILGIKEFAL
ncbi:3-keto-5-aminohexanoate cleavage protein [Sedimentibacter sp.]|uniref:3-keto-5-aminohexanoate cleavage protein n=1 Tax=Sedimentibacter sp. TaxID=1960295 RepID=UPI00289B0617|nr:3-keto-5-aminohexanoate cleavage protein [Sedimentibacter sp.]